MPSSTPKTYTYQSIQAIVKFGGNDFMLSRVLEYINLEKNNSTIGNQPLSTTIVAQSGNALFAMLLPLMQVKSLEEIISIEQSARILSSQVNLTVTAL